MTLVGGGPICMAIRLLGSGCGEKVWTNRQQRRSFGLIAWQLLNSQTLIVYIMSLWFYNDSLATFVCEYLVCKVDMKSILLTCVWWIFCKSRTFRMWSWRQLCVCDEDWYNEEKIFFYETTRVGSIHGPHKATNEGWMPMQVSKGINKRNWATELSLMVKAWAALVEIGIVNGCTQ